MSDGYILHEFNSKLKDSVKFIIDKTSIPKNVVEIGVFQGYFTFNMTEMLAPNNSNYKHYSIDPYDKSDDLSTDMIEQAYKCFLHNMNICPYSNHIEHIRETSWNGMLQLLNRGIKADLIYVDGDHRASTVLDDLVIAFKLLKVGGVMLCDDSVSWGSISENELIKLDHSPRLAVDSFIHCNWSKIEVLVLPNGYQSAFIKRYE